ncbi:MAG: UbiH/UbiF/VisC/COQ6 family ubiquinone biosynthesis hydroxylase [Methylococcales bacterium]
MKQEVDVLIVGGGMVGAALGCCLGGTDLSVAVVEGARPPEYDPAQAFDLRVSALSIASRVIMETVGAWPGIASRRLCPFRRMRVWENNGETEFCADEIQTAQLGYIVENRLIQLAFLERVESLSNVQLFCPVATRKIRYDTNGSSVELEDGSQISARLLVAADGGQSRVRQLSGIGVTAWDYRQHALVISVETAYAQQDITWQRFVPQGPQAFLPLPGPHASLVWYHSPDEIRRLNSLDDEDLLAELERAFPDCLGEIRRVAGRASFPLRRQHAQDYVKHGLALIGDAAHIINPLAGQGVNIGFMGAAALAEVIVAAARKGRDIASLAILREYEKKRRRENLLMMTTTELFYRIFSNDHLPVKIFRNLGLGLANRLSPAKKLVMRYAIGLEGNLPKLARGRALLD